MRTEEEIDLIARKLHAELFATVGDAIYAVPECQAHARRLCCVVLTAEEADAVTDQIETIAINEREKAIEDAITVWITEVQAEKVREYLEDDRKAHTAAGNAWCLDSGKLSRALELAGVGVRSEVDAKVDALAINTVAFELRSALENADDVLECNCGETCDGSCTKAWLAKAGGAAHGTLQALSKSNALPEED